MHAEYHIDRANGYLDMTISGEVTLPALFAFIATGHADPDYDPEMPGVTDFRSASLAFTFDEMLEYVNAEASGGKWNRAPWAYVVAPGDDAMYGTLRMYQNMVAGTRAEVGLFRSPDEARAWLRSKRP